MIILSHVDVYKSKLTDKRYCYSSSIPVLLRSIKRSTVSVGVESHVLPKTDKGLVFSSVTCAGLVCPGAGSYFAAGGRYWEDCQSHRFKSRYVVGIKLM